MPDWIARCLDTTRRHAPALRLLGPADFDALRDQDRDIDLSRLHVAQRADVIRAFLLMRFGGLWIDADCIVMRDLSGLLAQLRHYEVIAHRERQGSFSNAFLAMRPESPVAMRFYQTLCARLRGRRPLPWTALGNDPLTAELRSAPESVLELPPQAVQPVCWSEPERFFIRGWDAVHAGALDADAWCYMLSNQNILRHQGKTQARLQDPASFFSFLVRTALADAVVPVAADPPVVPQARRVPQPKAAPLTEAFARLGAEHAAQGHESAGGPGSSLHQTTELRRVLPLLLQHFGARVLLDLCCGDFHWMSRVELGVERYVGADWLEEQVRRVAARYAAPGRAFLSLNVMDDDLPQADIVLCRDRLVHLSAANIRRTLSNIKASGSTYLLATTFPGRRANPDIADGGWRPLDLQAAPFSLPPPLHLINERCPESGGAFRDKSLGLWRLADLAT